MANKKISELQSRTPSLSDLLLVGDPSSGYSYKCTVTALATIIETDIADGYVTIGTTQTISGAKTFSNNLTLTSVSNANTDTDKFLVLNASNIVNFRTGAEVLSDIGGQGALTLTTTGTSGAATLVGNTLNIPQYQSVLTNPVTGTGTTNYLAKFTGTSTIGNSLVFDDGTNVGISTTSPAYKLDVNGDLRVSTIANATTDTDRFLVSDSGVIKYRTGSELLSDIGGQAALTNPVTGTGTTNYIPKFTSSSAIGNSVIYESSGNIGIGTTSPTERLHSAYNVASGASGFGDGSFILKRASDGLSVANFSINTASSLANLSTAYSFLTFETESSERMRLTNTGLGIGTSSPAARLHVLANDGLNEGVAAAIIRQGGSAGNNGILIDVTNTPNAYVADFRINNSSVMRLDASGNVGIGTTSPTSITNYTALTINGTSGSFTEYQENTTNTFRVGTDGGNGGFLFTQSTLPIRFGTNSTERMRITSGGNVGIGTTTPGSKLAVVGLPTSATGLSTGDFYRDGDGYVLVVL